MPTAFVVVKCQDGNVVQLDVDPKTKVDEFRDILSRRANVPREQQRLVFNGRVLQDGSTLASYNIANSSTLHLLRNPVKAAKGPTGPTAASLGSIPGQLGSMQQHLLLNPDIMQQMMNSPAMQSLLNDAEFLRSLLQMNPQMREMMEQHPELRQMLHDDGFMQQSLETFRNPSMMREMLRSTDRAMSHIESVPGGFDALRHMYDELARKENMDPSAPPAYGAPTAVLPPKGANQQATKKPGDDDDDKDSEMPAAGPPTWAGTFDTNAMAAMLQDPNMQQLFAQLIQTKPGPGMKQDTDNPFSDPGFISQMFQPQTMTAMSSMQQAVSSMSVQRQPAPSKPDKGKDKSKEEKEEAPPSAAVALSGLNPLSPAANFSQAFAHFLQAQQENPEVQYRNQLTALRNMGFNNTDACIQALHHCDGNMNRAIDKMLAEGNA
eukprot:gnl/MRDRNA2_/MRDRNA2_89293_c0_seq1.p1 gnl/MRDRNA2_/MRDRNA2_89293_c0~~gnl/MRDRNA2_/MRDRNA2_89293_c0_seq1.p1  ORF type:complete len:435 (+),score=111.42 gnl/MRDRNA2_/MRDRNA2_89293_c0_seq1:62-1366(+)